jgi:hypothetical protein
VREFESARSHLIDGLPDILLTDVRLGAFNGIQLVLSRDFSIFRKCGFPERTRVESVTGVPFRARRRLDRHRVDLLDRPRSLLAGEWLGQVPGAATAQLPLRRAISSKADITIAVVLGACSFARMTQLRATANAVARVATHFATKPTG